MQTSPKATDEPKFRNNPNSWFATSLVFRCLVKDVLTFSVWLYPTFPGTPLPRQDRHG